ncbi:hypothetical protein HU200_040655 [Digitaria exilis]|uniref:Uncharacterized protein n=1 Tax=Digitaria exilis TaxID=1010633 RepID=A0A835EK69_9POAL|nr:hypothetical protein HU200_040655 [Digitaria exilis]
MPGMLACWGFPWGQMVVWDWLPIGCRWQQEHLGLDTLGDIELPKTCFKNPLWESVSEELWPLVAKYWMDSISEARTSIWSAITLKEEQRLNFGRYDVKRVVRSIYVLFSRSKIPIAKEDIADLLPPLPEWFTEDDLAVYASLYEKSGFRYPMEMPYRSLHKRKPIEDPKFQVPVFVVMGKRPKRKPIEDPKSGCGGPTSF